MCRADDVDVTMDASGPDYNQRLGYGTDQGRWLVQEVGDAPKRRPAVRTPQWVFHEIGEGVAASADQAPMKPDMLQVRQGALSAQSRSPKERRRMLVGGALGLCTLCALLLWAFS